MRISDVYESLVTPDVPVGFRAYDGSSAGPRDAEVVVELRSPLALRYLATAPGELGLSRAYVTGAIEIHGDLHTALVGLVPSPRGCGARRAALDPAARALGTLRPPPIPPEEAPPPWRRGFVSTRQARDAADRAPLRRPERVL